MSIWTLFSRVGLMVVENGGVDEGQPSKGYLRLT